ncbi:hypothetical protein BST61_g4153 [Cercospora zeina]
MSEQQRQEDPEPPNDLFSISISLDAENSGADDDNDNDDDAAEAAAGDKSSSVDRTFQSEEEFQKQKASYVAKIYQGGLLKELVRVVRELGQGHWEENEEADSGEGKGKNEKGDRVVDAAPPISLTMPSNIATLPDQGNYHTFTHFVHLSFAGPHLQPVNFAQYALAQWRSLGGGLDYLLHMDKLRLPSDERWYLMSRALQLKHLKEAVSLGSNGILPKRLSKKRISCILEQPR